MFNASVEPMRALAAALRAMPIADQFSVAITEYVPRDFSLVDINGAGCSDASSLRTALGNEREHERPSSGLVYRLAAGIQIAHDDVEHLTRHSRIALGDRHVRPELTIDIGEIAIGPRRRRQTRAAAANEALSFSRGDSSLERPAGDLRIVRLG